MKTNLLIISAVLLILFAVIIGQNGSEVCQVFVLAGITTGLFAVRAAQGEQTGTPDKSKSDLSQLN